MGRVSTPWALHLSIVSKIMHNYIASVSCSLGVRNENHKGHDEGNVPYCFFYKSNLVCKHFIALVLVPELSQLRYVIFNNCCIFLICLFFYFAIGFIHVYCFGGVLCLSVE